MTGNKMFLRQTILNIICLAEGNSTPSWRDKKATEDIMKIPMILEALAVLEVSKNPESHEGEVEPPPFGAFG